MDFTVSYAPSLTLLSASQRRAKDLIDGAKTLVMVCDPTGDLPYALVEGIVIKDRFPAGGSALHGPELSLPALWSDIRNGAYIHLACHATLATEEDLAALDLGTMRPVVVSDIRDFWRLEHARLVTLSACDTGIGAFFELANETTGMVEALFGVGASTIVASLWAVDDLSTFLIMDELYRLIVEEGFDPPAALCGAQRWLLNTPPKELERRLTTAQSKLPNVAEALRPGFDKQFEAARSSLRQVGERWNDDKKSPDDYYSHPYYWGAFRCIGI